MKMTFFNISRAHPRSRLLRYNLCPRTWRTNCCTFFFLEKEYLLVGASSMFFTITAEIHARSLAKFYGQNADRHINLKSVRRVSEREREIRPSVIVKNKLIHSYFDNVMTKFMINNRRIINWRQFVKWTGGWVSESVSQWVRDVGVSH